MTDPAPTAARRRGRPRRALSLTLAMLSLASAAMAGTLAVAQPDAAASEPSDAGAVTKTATVSRVNLIDGKDQTVDERKVTVSADITKNLRDRQGVNVTWSGARPTGGVRYDANSINAPYAEYPMVVLQCRGTETTRVKVSPETCFTQTPDLRYQPPTRSLFPPYRVDRYETPANREQNVGVPKPLPEQCETGFGAQRYVPFVAQDGTVYRGGSQGCAGLAPEQSIVSDPLSPSNATFATTAADGTGTTRFIVQDGQDNASLGCSDTVACSLVVIPIEGISCDPSGDAPGLAAADRPTGTNKTTATRLCTRTGFYDPGQPAGDQSSPDPNAQLAVTGLLWWSESNWRNRITIPIGFATTAASCDITAGGTPVGVYGSQYMAQAVAQWSPATCADKKLFQLQYTQTSEVQAKNLLATGTTNGKYLGVQSAFQAGPPAAPFSNPVVQAPAALSGFAIGYVIDDADGKEYKNLRLNARLLAKLLSMSYPTYPAIKGDWAEKANAKYNSASKNPLTMSVDPEFLALNPGAKTPFINQLEASSTLFAMSSDADAMTALTSYIDSDPEARAFLDGTPDPWGMRVNPNYKDISLPVSSWPQLDTLYDPLGNQCIEDGRFPVLPLVAGPVSDPSVITFNMQLGINNAQVNCVVSGQTDSASTRRLTGIGRQQAGVRFLLGLVSLADAQRYQIDTASLQTHNDNDPDERFSDGSGRTFAGPTDKAILAAGKLLRPDSTLGTWTVPYKTLNSSEAGRKAYPGTLLMSTDVPTSGLDPAGAEDYAKLLTFIAGRGQNRGTSNGDLPPGYVPITEANGLGALHKYSVLAARAVSAQKGQRLDPANPVLSDGASSRPSGGDAGGSGSGGGSGDGGGGSGDGGAGGADAPAGAPANAAPAAGGATASAASPAPAPSSSLALTSTARTKGVTPGVTAAVIPALAIFALVMGAIAMYTSGLFRRRA